MAGRASLRTVIHQLWSMELQDSTKSGNSRAKVNEEVQAILKAATVSPWYTSMSKPGFVIKIANDSDGVSAYSAPASSLVF